MDKLERTLLDLVEINVNIIIQLKKHKLVKENPYYWIEKYANAQEIMGIDITLKHKRDIIGYDCLEDQPVRKLKQLIYALRYVYKGIRRSEAQSESD